MTCVPCISNQPCSNTHSISGLRARGGRCKKDQFHECTSAIFQFGIDTSYELDNCARSMPACYKNREVCLGTCGGEDIALRHDFATDVARRELSIDALGSDGFASARANCTAKTQIAYVPLFEGGEALAVYSNYLRTRSGMTAINPIQCATFPQACRAITKVLETSPTLVYEVGKGFRHAYTGVPPSPPSPPFPPPGLKFREFEPPPPNSPPPSPPPYYEGADECAPIISAVAAGFDAGDPTLPRDEDRDVCVYVRRILDERRETHDCFQVRRAYGHAL